MARYGISVIVEDETGELDYYFAMPEGDINPAQLFEYLEATYGCSVISAVRLPPLDEESYSGYIPEIN